MTQAKRTYVELSDEKRAEIRRAQVQVKEELPELAKRLRMANEAAQEKTFSGALRRAIHASGFHLNYIADHVGTTPIVLDEFLTGEGTLQSDTIDRLVALLGYTPLENEGINGKCTNAFVTYENYRDPHVTIHRAGCSQIRKRGGEHKYGQGGYKEHGTFHQAEQYANSTNLRVVRCSYCNPEHAHIT